MTMIAASACLLGYCCRYDGRTSPDEALVNRTPKEAVLPICPEELGGLSTPRTPCELHGGDGFDVLDGRARVVDSEGKDVTQAFLMGAFAALKRIKENNIQFCYLKDKSPSCGVGRRSGDRQPIGVTAALFIREGIEVEEVIATAIDKACKQNQA